MFAKFGCSKYAKSKQNLKRYDRRKKAVCALNARREHAASTFCAP